MLNKKKDVEPNKKRSKWTKKRGRTEIPSRYLTNFVVINYIINTKLNLLAPDCMCKLKKFVFFFTIYQQKKNGNKHLQFFVRKV